jgi:transposase InsO family protein
MEKALDEATESALKRYAVIAPLLEAGLGRGEASARRQRVLAESGVNARTLRRWIASYRTGGFESLKKRRRSDAGEVRGMSADALSRAEELRRELPRRSAETITEQLAREGYEAKRSTVERVLRRRGLSRKELVALGVAGASPSRRFARKGRNALWQADIKYGPYVAEGPGDKKRVRTYMLAIIDDATRAVVHAAFYANARQPILEDGLRRAIVPHGSPKALYVDNGKIFTSAWTEVVCARLGIRLLKARAYSPESKGKIERFNRTVGDSFLSELSLSPAATLSDLNEKFAAWLSEGYNHKPHSALDGKTPADVFRDDATPIRFHSIEALADAFLHEEERRVDKAGCFKLEGRQYDAGPEWARKKISVRFDPFHLEEVQLWDGGERKKIVKVAVIGEYNQTQRVSCETVEAAAGSRVLASYEKASRARFKKKLGAFRLGAEGKR